MEKVATSTCQWDVQQFLGLANYYRRFVKNFSTIAKPVHRLTEKNVSFEWRQEAAEAFAQLKQRLTSPPVLAHLALKKMSRWWSKNRRWYWWNKTSSSQHCMEKQLLVRCHQYSWHHHFLRQPCHFPCAQHQGPFRSCLCLDSSDLDSILSNMTWSPPAIS